MIFMMAASQMCSLFCGGGGGEMNRLEFDNFS